MDVKISPDARRLLGQAVRSVDQRAMPHMFPQSKKEHAEELQKAGLALVRFSEGTVMPTKLGRLVFGAPAAQADQDPRMVVPPRSPAGILQTVIYAAAERLGVPVDTSANGNGDKTGALIIARACLEAFAINRMEVGPLSGGAAGPCAMCGTAHPRHEGEPKGPMSITCVCCNATTGDVPYAEAVERWNRGEIDYPEKVEE